jgi:hypothetical protein
MEADGNHLNSGISFWRHEGTSKKNKQGPRKSNKSETQRHILETIEPSMEN